MFFLLYKHTDDGVSDDFPKISDHFPKIFENFPKLFRSPGERPRTFSENSENSRRCTKTSQDCRRLSRKTRRCFDDTPTNLSTISETNLISVKSSISSHVRISYLHMWGYRIVFINLLPLGIPTSFPGPLPWLGVGCHHGFDWLKVWRFFFAVYSIWIIKMLTHSLLVNYRDLPALVH